MIQPPQNASDFFERLADEIDVPEGRQKEAVDRYKSVGKFLNRDQSALAYMEPDVYPQGSFRLGTAIRPVNDGEEYDIDLVLQLNSTKRTETQENLKTKVGLELKLYASQNGMNSEPEPKRRCWTLEYADDAQFHLDVLPALPDSQRMRQMLFERGFTPTDFSDQSIAITDEQHYGYSIVCEDWHQSNPRGYADWFASRMKIRLDEQRQVVAKRMNASVEEVPDYKVKTPLQRAVQILKRHRDTVFGEDEHKPISVIITTLAAHSYDNEASLASAMEKIVFGMEGFIQQQNGRAYIPNPVNPLENFADKWAEEPKKEQKFRSWLEQLKTDYQSLLSSHDLSGQRVLLEKRFGERTISKVYPKASLLPAIKNSALSLYSNVAQILSVPHRQVPKWPVQNLYQLAVQATFERNGFRPQDVNSDGSAVPKDGKLRFHAVSNYDGPCRIYWQVVNTGAQAENEKGLRGGFYEGKIERGGKVRTESTRFTGKHWVECFLVRGNVCLARSGEFIVNIQ